MNQYRYQLERYRGRGSRYVCPKCRHKHSFTRYIDTYNNNIYINDDVGKCNRLDKCGYHYTPRQYFEDNPWLRDINTPPYTWTDSHLHRQNVRPSTPHFDTIPEWIVEGSLRRGNTHVEWLRRFIYNARAMYILLLTSHLALFTFIHYLCTKLSHHEDCRYRTWQPAAIPCPYGGCHRPLVPLYV